MDQNQHKKRSRKSILDYAVTNENLYEDIIKMTVDEEKLYRLTKYKGREVKETDHNTIIIEINDEKLKQKKEKICKWNTKSQEGWKKFKEATENNKDLDDTCKSENIQIEWKKWLKITEKILSETFGRVRITDNQKQGMDEEVKAMLKRKRELRKATNETNNTKEKENLIEQRKQIESQIKKKIEENEEDKINEFTQKLDEKRNNNEALWQLKNKTQKKQTTAFILKDVEGNDIGNPDGIKSIVSDHYSVLYENNPVQEGYENYVKELELLIKLIWETEDETRQELETEDIIEIINNLEKKKATGPDEISNEMIQDGGASLKQSIIRMMKIIYKK